MERMQRWTEPTLLMVPGWNGSGPGHWQRRWLARVPRAAAVEQADWARPQVRPWVSELAAALRLQRGPVVLVAHSLGCITVAHWAARSFDPKACGALMVAPADVERADAPAELVPFRPIPLTRLPFPTLTVGSSNDPAASAERARAFAQAWGGEFVCLPGVGHINVASGHGDWPQGLALLRQWMRRAVAGYGGPLVNPTSNVSGVR